MKFVDERELFASVGSLRTPVERGSGASVWKHVMKVFEYRWIVLASTVLALAVGALALVAMRPVYEATLVVQVADTAGPQKGFLGESAGMFDIKSPATAEMEIMRSRMIVGPVMERHQLFVTVRPRFFPLVGTWQARDPDLPLAPGGIAIGPWAWIHGARGLAVREFEVSPGWEGRTFVVRAEGHGQYSLHHPSLPRPVPGRAGERLTAGASGMQLSLLITEVNGEPGAEFALVRKPRVQAVEDVQGSLKLSERGRQSGVIEASFRDSDPARAAAVLNAIGANYIRQDFDRKTAEAEKSIAFLNSQLPGLKEQMDRAESAYNRFRARNGTVSPSDEAKIAVEQTAFVRGRLADAQQRRRDLLANLGTEHPAVRVVDEQIAGLHQELRNLQGRVSELPSTQQATLRLEREARLSGELYQQLRSSLLQLQLLREGQSSNARIIDTANAPYLPVGPRAPAVLGAAAGAGLLLGILAVLARGSLERGVKTVGEIEAISGLNVYASPIPFSKAQRHVKSRPQKLLALAHRTEEAAIGMRQLRSQLQHQMREQGNNRLMITGPTRGVGVHFVGANLGAVLAAGGRRVLLIDVDGQNASLHRYFDMAGAPGLAELIEGACLRNDALKPTGVPGLDLITAGHGLLDIDALMSSRVFLELLDSASKDYDMVILTAPPVLQSGEALMIASAATSVMLVARARTTHVEALAESAVRLSKVGRFPAGVLLNAA